MTGLFRRVMLGLIALGFVGVSPSWAANLLYSFSFDTTKGGGPVSGLVADSHGALYGTTYEGGANGRGIVFQLKPPAPGKTSWTQTVLYSFCAKLTSQGCQDGAGPGAGVIFSTQPNGVTALFGVTAYGGSSNNGTIFRLSPKTVNGTTTWTFTKLYEFSGSDNSDGSYPLGGLIAGGNGILYGTTNGGGTGHCNNGCGTIFKLTPPNSSHPSRWNETVLYSFGSTSSDGEYPKASLIADKNGALYGTTYEGGSTGYGTVFRLTPPAGETIWRLTTLHSFAGGNEGAYPRAGLAIGPGGGLYGTTAYGGANCDNNDGCGTVFRLAPSAGKPTAATWKLSTLHSFKYNYASDGQYPLGTLIFGTDGALYGTTEYGGTPNGDGNGPCGYLYRCGTIFRLTGAGANWDWTLLYKFCNQTTGCPIGAYPTAGLLAYNGKLYGTTSSDADGYACNCGAVFELDYPGTVFRPAPRTPPPHL